MLWQQFLRGQWYQIKRCAENVNMGVEITKREWVLVFIWSALVLLIVSLPYVYGAYLSTPANQFGGFVIGVEDGNSYLAKMRLGATGGWQFHLFYTSEPHPGAYLFLFHLLLGKIAHLTGGSFILIYHLARIVCGFVLLLTTYYWIAFFTSQRPVRQLAFWLTVLGSGLGWLVVLSGLLERIGLPLDFYSPEAFTFHVLFALPHLALAEALLLWGILFVWLAWERQQWRYAGLAGFALLGMSILGAFYVFVAAAIVGIGLWLQAGQKWNTTRKPQFWLKVRMSILVLTLPMPVILYNAYVFTYNPVFKVWAAQNLILSPPPVHYLLSFGLLLVLAMVGAWRKWLYGSERSLMLIGWCIVVPLLVYIPFNLQRRMTLGVQVPLSILAAVGLWYLFTTYFAAPKEYLRYWPVTSIGIVLFFSLTNIFIVLGAVLEVNRQTLPLFHSGNEVDAANWLGENATSNEVVLAGYETGNYLPTRMPARVFVGHGPETVYSDAKRNMLTKFFATNNDEFRRQLLVEHGITYLVYGPAERALGNFDPAQAFYLDKVYSNQDIQIYRIKLAY